MIRSFRSVLRVAFGRAMSTAIALWVLIAAAASAHEVIPAIVDMEQVEDRLVFDVAAPLESFVAGIDLNGLGDTNSAPEAERYDSLRIMDPEAFAAEVNASWPELSAKISVEADGQPLTLTFEAVEVPAPGDIELPRTSVLRFSADLPAGAAEVEVGWDASLGTMVLRQQGVEKPYDGYLDGGARSGPIALEGGNQKAGWKVLLGYVPVGLDHIVPLGLDHILFVLGLFFLSQRLGPLLWQVSAFTLAHTITLALAALGYVTVPAAIVEPLIALSIVYVAVENVLNTSGRLSPWRPVVIFAFGLLHGLGFASVLAEFGLPQSGFLPALIGFNIGVELGQLLVIAVAYLIVVKPMRNSAIGVEDRLWAGIFMALAVVVLPGLLVPLGGAEAEVMAAALPLLLAAAVLAGLSAASLAAEGQGSYDWIVASPASILIALVGAYWVVERVFL